VTSFALESQFSLRKLGKIRLVGLETKIINQKCLLM
jgi:hypothetical protein